MGFVAYSQKYCLYVIHNDTVYTWSNDFYMLLQFGVVTTKYILEKLVHRLISQLYRSFIKQIAYLEGASKVSIASGSTAAPFLTNYAHKLFEQIALINAQFSVAPIFLHYRATLCAR